MGINLSKYRKGAENQHVCWLSAPHVLLVAMLMLAASSCHGLLEELYDEPTDNVSIKQGQLYVNASSWLDWYYIDFNATSAVVRYGIPTEASEDDDSTTPSSGIYTYWYDIFGIGLSNHDFRGFMPTAPQPAPDTWHIAVHRNNVRTNGGAAYETSYTSMQDLPESSEAFADAPFTEDEWNQLDVWAVQSRMLQGLIGNQGIKVNPVLSRWLTMDIPPMPPAFTLNNHVFIVRFADDTYAAIQLENYQSPMGTKCCLTINYKYPY